ncbi:nuclear transport factor 2 family protein [Pseudonocardia ammonioxydans]|uniref:nuclear transport factor 2 family protein n=1 Tax=Pseudonocardia ammonioxydans TaxID=260086 RepID=UPI001FE3EA83|nr:nuclear transport factor 2 family protein [Pseudonocardia ammonioxydans]
MEEIKILKARYFRYADTKRMDLFRDLFVPGATALFHDIHTEAKPIDEVLGTLEKVVEQCTTIHRGFMPEIEILGPKEARGVWAMEDQLHWTTPSPDGVSHMIGYGHYYETYRLHQDSWRISTLELTRLRLEILTEPRDLTTRPPLEAHLQAERGPSSV